MILEIFGESSCSIRQTILLYLTYNIHNSENHCSSCLFCCYLSMHTFHKFHKAEVGVICIFDALIQHGNILLYNFSFPKNRKYKYGH